MSTRSPIIVRYEGPIASITLNRPDKLGSLQTEDFEAFAAALYDIDKRPEVVVTIWQGRGRFFCAGANIVPSTSSPSVSEKTQSEIGRTLYYTRALSTHSKILVAALNGPAFGIGAAFLGYFDFIYATPSAWIAVPFSALGIVAEVGSSVTFPRLMGLSKAIETLLWGRKVSAAELVKAGFINKVFPLHDASALSTSSLTAQIAASDAFNAEVHDHLLDLISPLDPAALLATKFLIKAGLQDVHSADAVGVREASAQVERSLSGVPRKRFGEIARGERRHRL